MDGGGGVAVNGVDGRSAGMNGCVIVLNQLLNSCEVYFCGFFLKKKALLV